MHRRYHTLDDGDGDIPAVRHNVTKKIGARSYPVHTKTGGRVRHYVEQLFDSKVKTLCILMKEDTGKENPDCGGSTAYTTWSYTMTQDELYDSVGGKQALSLQYWTNATLPHWENIKSAGIHDAAEARRADLRTAYHEAGHQSTPAALCDAIVRFADAMPASVSSSDVHAYNTAVKFFITSFYVTMARAADERYDGTTGHGLLQGAEYSSTPILKREPDSDETPVDWMATATAASDTTTALPQA